MTDAANATGGLITHAAYYGNRCNIHLAKDGGKKLIFIATKNNRDSKW